MTVRRLILLGAWWLGVAAPSPALADRTGALATPDTDRAALAQRLREAGVSGVRAGHLARDVAEVGLEVRLSASRPGARASRLGGAGLLPAGMRWPRHGARGRPLSFLGAIDLAEAYAAGADARLPRTGTLLFYADIDNGDADGLIDTSGNGPRDPARAIYVADRRRLRAAEAPAAIRRGDHLLLRRCWARFHARLTLSDAYDAAARLGLSGAEAKGYDTIAAALIAGGGTTGPLPHWIGGLATGAQGDVDPADTVDLFQIASDPRLAFDYLDAGVIQFRIGASALRRRDWSAVRVDADSS